MLAQLRTAFLALLVFTLLTGVMYPVVVTLFAQTLLHDKANGSRVVKNGKVVGSKLIGQAFDDDPRYFWGRPSAVGYNGANSGGSNLGPTNPALEAAVRDRARRLREFHDPKMPIPVDLVTASASGLDPHISPAAAEYQIKRVVAARKGQVSEERVRQIVAACTEGRTFGLLGEPRVNVLQVNLALDDASGRPK